MSAWMPAAPPESDDAMDSTRGTLTLCLPLASGAPPASPSPFTGAAFPRRSSLAPQSRRHRAPAALSPTGGQAGQGRLDHALGELEILHLVRQIVAVSGEVEQAVTAQGGQDDLLLAG